MFGCYHVSHSGHPSSLFCDIDLANHLGLCSDICCENLCSVLSSQLQVNWHIACEAECGSRLDPR